MASPRSTCSTLTTSAPQSASSAEAAGHERVLRHLEDADALHDCGHDPSVCRRQYDQAVRCRARPPAVNSILPGWAPSGTKELTQPLEESYGSCHDEHGSTSRSSMPTTTCTRPRTRSPATSPSGTRAPSTTSTSAGARRSSCGARSASTSPTRPSRWWRGPGAQEEYFRVGNPEGKSYREIVGDPMRCHPGLPRPRAPPRADGRAGRRPHAHVPDARQPPRGAHARRPRADPRRDPLAQRVDPRRVVLQLRGPHLRHAGHHPADRREGDRGARVVRRAGRQDGADPPGPGARPTAARARSASRSSTRSGRPSSTTTSSSRCTPPTAATRATRATGPARRRCCRSGPTPSACSPMGKRPIEDTMAALRVPRRLHPVPRPARSPPSRTAATGSCRSCTTSRTSTGRCRRRSTRTRSRRSSATSTSTRSTRTTSPGSSTCWAPTTCCSAPTSRTPRAWPTPAATSTTCPTGCPRPTWPRIMGGNLGRLMRVDATAAV